MQPPIAESRQPSSEDEGLARMAHPRAAPGRAARLDPLGGIRHIKWITTFCLIGCSLPLIACGATDSTAEKDGNLVLCMSGPARRGVVDAAVVLGLGQRTTVADQISVDQKTLTLETWRAGHPRAFDRACDAYLTASQQRAAPSADGPAATGGWGIPLLTTVLSLLVAVVTAIVGGIVTVWVSGADRRQRLAQELRTKALAFQDVGIGYVASFLSDRPPQVPDALFTAKASLDGVLQRAEAGHQRWRMVPAVRVALGAAPLADQSVLDRDMNGPSQQAVNELRQRVETAVLERTMDALRLAEAIETPMSSIRRLRASDVSALRSTRRPLSAAVDQSPGVG